MKKGDRSVEANLHGAKQAVNQMTQHWKAWKAARNPEEQTQAIGAYAAAFTSCKVFIENYLRHFYPREQDVPQQVSRDLKRIVTDLEIIEKMNDARLNDTLQAIEQLRRHAA